MVTSVYNYLAETYVPKSYSRYDTHKKTELRDLYSRIIKKTKNSPLYKIKMTSTQQANVITMKDTALSIGSTLSNLNPEDEYSVFSYKKAYSQNPENAEAEIITEDESKLPDAFYLKVNNLAIPQINRSRDMRESDTGIHGDDYSFAIDINSTTYNFKVKVASHSTNGEIFHEISNCINRAHIGLHSYVTSPKEDMVNLAVQSNHTGSIDNEDIFNIYDTGMQNGRTGIMEYYRLDSVRQHPKNASFSINGSENESVSNEFKLNKSLKVTLHSPSEEEFLVGYTNNDEKITEGLEKLRDSYNILIDLSNGEKDALSKKLTKELGNLSGLYRSNLESSGISFDEEGHMQIDSFLAMQSSATGDLQELFSDNSSFVRNFKKKLSSITLDPLEYVQKKLVTYPNTSKPGIANPYQISIYSGLLFNYYC